MFTRSSPAEPKPLAPAGANSAGVRSAPPRPRPASEPVPKSVIGNDLKIIGQGLKLVSQGTLQVDGEVEGGTVAAERVIVRGTISGVIRGATVTLQSSSHVEGDIHHMSLAIEQGAEFDGRCRRAADASQLTTDLSA